MTLPKFINCKSETTSHCDFYMHNDCAETCAYAKDIGGIGYEAAHPSIFQGLEKKVEQ